jgi:hypothetical protein
MAINQLSYSDVGTAAVDKINSNLNTLQAEADALSGRVTAEQQARTAADQQQAGAVAQQQQALASAVQTLQGAITAETQTRSQAVATISQQVASEAQARSGADTAEATARTNADNALSARITSERTDRQTAVTAEATARAQGVQQSLDAVASETQARVAAISAEAAARAGVAGDLATLAGHVDAAVAGEATARSGADGALGARVDGEVKARGDADTALGVRIDSETAARVDADTALNDQVDAEAKTRGDADAALGSRIDGEASSRAQSIAAEADARHSDFAVLRVIDLVSARPGDVAAAFTADLEMVVSELPSSIAPASTATGRVMRMSGAGLLAPVAFQPVEAGRLIKVRAVVRRYVDTLDPAGDAIGLFLAWYGVDRAMLGAPTRVAVALLTAARGPIQLGALVSPDIGDTSTLRPPTGAVYLRPFVQTWGDTAVTDVEVIETKDVTDFGGVSVDLDAVVNRLASVEAIQAAIPGEVRRRSFVRAMMYGG